MKTFILASTVLATLAAAAVPASAQYAFTGDGIFGHDYRSEQAAETTDGHLAVGYAEDLDRRKTGSVRAVTRENAASAVTSEKAGRTDAKTPLVDLRR